MNAAKLIKELNKKEKLEQNWKNDDWLLRQLNKERMSQKDYDFLIGIRNVLSQIYQENYDIWISYCFASDRKIAMNLFEIVIYYPELIVTNDIDSIKIKDLFVKFKFYPKIINTFLSVDSSIQGTRTSCNYLEYICKYEHSHLHKKNYLTNIGVFDSFCTGTSEINNILLYVKANLERSTDTPIDFNLLRMLFYQLNSFVKWQSDEGVPYIRIKNVNFKEYLDDPYIEEDENIVDDYLFRKTENYKPNLKYFIINDIIKLDDYRANLSIFLDNKLPLTVQEQYKAYFDEQSNRFYDIQPVSSDIDLNNKIVQTKPFIFKGQTIPYNIENLDEEQINDYNNTLQNLKKVYKKNFIQHVTTKLESKINEEILKKYITSK